MNGLPLPTANVTIRPAVLSDIPFMDSLQKLHTKQVGWMPRAQFEGKIKLGHVLIAETMNDERGTMKQNGCRCLSHRSSFRVHRFFLSLDRHDLVRDRLHQLLKVGR
jgi:hypothetical protein